jgi:23S rRNA maturation-related 3'-5' exoribonuclease YhaM
MNTEDLIERDIDKEAPVIQLPPKESLMTKVDHYDLLTVRPFLKTHNARLTRKRYAETSVREYLNLIEPAELKEQYLEFYDAHPLYKTVCAGAKHHHWWKGGLETHVCEMLGIGMDLMDLYAGDMVFTKSDFIISCFLHDFNKIWIYRELTSEDKANNPKKYHEKQVFGYHNNGREEIS